MNNLWRIVDVEFNRVSEGLRVLEDQARFVWQDRELTAALKQLRSEAARLAQPLRPRLLAARDAAADLGLELSQNLQLDHKTETSQLVTANLKRVQEGLRSLEEHLKPLGHYPLAKAYELLRFQAYDLEKQIQQQLERSRRRFPVTDLYGITAREFALGRSNLEVVKLMLAGELQLIQYREKELPLLEQYRECIKIRDLTAAAGACFIVNDHPDLARAVAADGVHLGQEDLPVPAVRSIVGEGLLIGRSTHSPQQAREAVKLGVDYIGVGPLYQTFTKKGVGPPVGLGYLDYVVKNIDLPLVAIGGIKQSNLAEVVRHGASCLALVTEIVGAKDIPAKIKALRREIAQAKESKP